MVSRKTSKTQTGEIEFPADLRKFGRISSALLLLLAASPAVAAQFEVIHTFANYSADGYLPGGRLALDDNGALYGTTARGGSACPTAEYTCGGTVYRLVKPAKQGAEWRLKVLATFKGGKDGSYPLSGVMRAADGALYGGTHYGGSIDCVYEPHHWGCGTLFRVRPPAPGEQKWRKTVLHRFQKETDGRFPDSPPIVYGNDDTLYGNTARGGSADAGMPYSIILANSASAAAQSTSGPAPDWHYIPAIPYHDSGGTPSVWYYSTRGGLPIGWDDCQPGETFVITDLANFEGSCVTGSYSSPPKPVHGNLFGVTSAGGDSDCIASGNQGCGLIFQFPQNSKGKFSYNVLYSFLGGTDGYWPNGRLVIGPDRALYGSTLWGGTSCPLEPVAGRGCGTVFRLSPPTGSATGWSETILYRFKGGDDGALPAGGLMILPDGSVYGATTNGGGCSYSTRGCGVIFKLTPPARRDKPWTETIVHTFQNGADGMSPNGPMTYDGVGAIYGTALNVVFRIVP